MKTEILQWHPAFYAAAQIEFGDELDKLHFENEHQLSLSLIHICPTYSSPKCFRTYSC